MKGKAKVLYKMINETKPVPKVSVVIPMYNCEQFLPDLFSMLLNQTLQDFEVICVIDGATDNTETIVKQFCEKDHRFAYVVQENSGPGVARNTGLDMARSEYVVFPDADDEYSVDYLKKLYDTAVSHDAQIVVSCFMKKDYLYNKETILGFEKKFSENKIYSHNDIDGIWGAFYGRIPDKIFNKNFLRTNNIRFTPIRVSQDDIFCSMAFIIADRILVVREVLTTFRFNINRNSVTRKRVRFQHETVEGLRLLYHFLKDQSLMDIYREDYLKKVNRSIMYAGNFEVSPRYISELAHMLNEEEPWNKMMPGDICSYLGESIFAKDAAKKKNEMIKNATPQQLETDE